MSEASESWESSNESLHLICFLIRYGTFYSLSGLGSLHFYLRSLSHLNEENSIKNDHDAFSVRRRANPQVGDQPMH